MTLTEILEQAKKLSPQERKELSKLLMEMQDAPTTPQPKTGAEIVAMLETMEPIEFVDEDIQDPVEWVEAQRRAVSEGLLDYMRLPGLDAEQYRLKIKSLIKLRPEYRSAEKLIIGALIRRGVS